MLIAPESAYPEYGAIPESTVNPEVVRIEEDLYLGNKLSRDYIFVDGDGRDYSWKGFGGKPLILHLSYYTCNGSCPTSNIRFKDVIKRIDRFKLKKDYGIMTLSFDIHDDIHAIRSFTEMTGLGKFNRNGWHVAVMKDKEDIKRITGDVGFKFFWSSRDKMFLHPNVFVFFSPGGRVVRYLYGSSLDERDIELALTESIFEKAERSGVIDLISMACYSYNYKEGKYTLNYPVFIGIGSMFLGISSIVVPILIIRKRREGRS